MIEIERKYLVLNNSYKDEAFQKNRIVQGYLSSVPERAVRVRIKGTKGFITIKGISNSAGMSRFEWEKDIELEEAEQLLLLCEKGIIDKIRYEIKSGEFLFEVDEFLGENLGLVVAEIELRNENDFFEKPLWLGEEVTQEKKYYNASLSQNPYLNWES